MLTLRVDVFHDSSIDSAQIHARPIKTDMRSLNLSKDLYILWTAVSYENLQMLVDAFRTFGLERNG